MKKIVITNQVARFRRVNGLDTSVLAERIGISRQALYKIEKGNALPSLSTAFKLAEYFDTSVDELFKWKK